MNPVKAILPTIDSVTLSKRIRLDTILLLICKFMIQVLYRTSDLYFSQE